MNQYLIPANTKKSLLIFNMFRLFDLLLLLGGALVTTVLMFAIPDLGVWGIVIKLAPVSCCLFLVMPIPYYHNILVFLKETYIYYTSPTRYLWRGWCASYVGDDEQKTKN